jgi:hypothetical protein
VAISSVLPTIYKNMNSCMVCSYEQRLGNFTEIRYQQAFHVARILPFLPPAINFSWENGRLLLWSNNPSTAILY